MTLATTAKTMTKVTNRLTGTLGTSIDQAWALREQKRQKEAEIKVIEAQIEAMEEVLFDRLDKEDTRTAAGKKASVSIITAVSGNVTDWEAFWPYIAKNKFWHLVQKRASDPGLRELWDMKKTIPGVQPFTKRKLLLKTLSA